VGGKSEKALTNTGDVDHQPGVAIRAAPRESGNRNVIQLSSDGS
jgi:hypothetical protein